MRSAVSWQRLDAVCLVVLAAFWWTAVYLTGHAGSIPLGDDWSFAKAAFRLAGGEGYNPPDWAAMTLVVHAVWGALLAKAFGFDFVALRGGMLALGLFCGVIMWAGLRRAGTPLAATAIAVAALLANPLYFALSHSFMTDGTFLTLLVAQAFCLMKCADDDLAWRWIGWASLATLLAALTRDPGVIPAFVMSMVVIAERRNLHALRSLLPFLAGAIAMVCFREWARSAGVDLSHSDFFREMFVFSLKAIRWAEWIEKFDSVLMYIGFFCMPLLLPVTASLMREPGLVRQRAAAGFLAGLAFMGGWFVFSGNMFPPEIGWMDEAGFVGQPMLYDVTILHVSAVPQIPRRMVVAATAVSIFGGAFLWAAMTGIAVLPTRKHRWAIFCALSALAGNVQWIIMGSYLDRYALPGIILVLIMCCVILSERPAPRRMVFGSAFIVMFFALWSVAGVHDFIEWQRARWVALEYLMRDLRAPASRIDGGFEFNGWYAEKHPIPYREYAFVEERIDLPTDHSWWWVGDAEYMVAFGPVDGYRVIGQFPYVRWMPGRSDWAIHALKRQ